MPDVYNLGPVAASESATSHFSVTPSDTVDLPIIPRSLFVTLSGTLKIRDIYGTDITYPAAAIPIGKELRLRPLRVFATGTTATVVGWF